MLGSAFSHIQPIHFVANMFVLWNFAPVAMHSLGVENFCAFYLTAGL